MSQGLAVITGGDRGIGYSVAEGLAKRGVTVVLASPDAEAGAIAVADIPGSRHVATDVSDTASVAALAEDVLATGAPDILVNCAGINIDQGGSRIEGGVGAIVGDAERPEVGRGAGILEIDPRLVAATFEVNALGSLRVAQVFLPAMVERGSGRVVNVSSERGAFGLMERDGDGDAPGYQISKAALNAATVMLAHAVREHPDVLVNAACPGWTQTEMGGPFAERTVEQGAESVLHAVDLPAGGPSGRFFRDGEPLAW